MPKKTLALISALVLVTVVLFVIALKSGQQGTIGKLTQTPSVSPSPSVAHSVLTVSPNPAEFAANQQGKVDVNIDTSDNPVTGVQLEISYDPKALKNVKVVPGQLFQNGVVLINKDDPVAGRLTFAVGKSPAQEAITGTGIVATITFTTSSTASASGLNLLPSTLVTARGVAESVLKSAAGTQVVVSVK